MMMLPFVGRRRRRRRQRIVLTAINYYLLIICGIVLLLLEQEHRNHHHHQTGTVASADGGDAVRRRRERLGGFLFARATSINAVTPAVEGQRRIQQHQRQLLVYPILTHSTIVERRRRRLRRSLRLNDGGGRQKEETTTTATTVTNTNNNSNSTTTTITTSTANTNNNNNTFLRGITTKNQLYQGYGTHFIDLYVGCSSDSRQRQTLIVDTGSTVTGFPCRDCQDCGTFPDYHLSRAYDETQSQCFKRASNCNINNKQDNQNNINKQQHDKKQQQHSEHSEQCLIGTSIYNQKRGEKKPYPKCPIGTIGSSYFNKKQSSMCYVTKRYSEGSSWNAYEGIDQVSMSPTNSISSSSSNSSFELHFACQTSVTGLFKEQLADGIMGLKNGKGSFWKQMYYSQLINKQQFSLCFLSAEAAAISATARNYVVLEEAEKEKAATKTTTAGNNQQERRQGPLPEEVGVMMFGGIIDDNEAEEEEEEKALPSVPQFQYDTPMVYTEMTMSKTGTFQVHVETMYLRVGTNGNSNAGTGGGKSGGAGEGVIILGDDDEAETTTNIIGKAIDISENDLNDGPFFIDSGATATYLSKNLELPFKNAWKESLKLMDSNKQFSEAYDPDRDYYKFTKDQISLLPTIIFEIKPWINNDGSRRSATEQQQQKRRVLIALSPQNYMHSKNHMNSYELYIYFTVSTKQRHSKQTLGANFIMGKQIVFDIDNLRFGFADSPKCDFVTTTTTVVNNDNDSTPTSSSSAEVAAAAAAANDDNTPQQQQQQKDEKQEEEKKVSEKQVEGQGKGEEKQNEEQQPKQQQPLPVDTNATTNIYNHNNNTSNSKSKEEFGQLEHAEYPTTTTTDRSLFILGGACVVVVVLLGVSVIVFRRRSRNKQQRGDYTYSHVDYEDYEQEEEETDNHVFTSSDSRSFDGSQLSFDGSSTDDEVEDGGAYYSTDDENFDTDDDTEQQQQRGSGGKLQLNDRSMRGRRARRRRRRKRTDVKKT